MPSRSVPSVRKLRRTRRPLVALLVLLVALVVGYAVDASRSDGPSPRPTATSTATGTNSSTGSGTVALSSLPPQAARTVRLIKSDGPFPYPENDGVVFHNYEHDLPSEPDGYYHEYTVPTPGSPDRGARRIVTGEDGRYYWTADHYDSFRLIAIGR